VALYLAYTFYWAALFPEPASGSPLGTPVESAVDIAVDWSRLHLFVVTDAIRDVVSYGLLNPFEALLAGSPWYLVCAVILGLAAPLPGYGRWSRRPSASVCWSPPGCGRPR